LGGYSVSIGTSELVCGIKKYMPLYGRAVRGGSKHHFPADHNTAAEKKFWSARPALAPARACNLI